MDQNKISSPADSRVLSFCEITGNEVLLVKDQKYKLGELLTGKNSENYSPEMLKNSLKNKDNKLYSAIFYLSPGDYHRYHSPADFKAKRRAHIAGYLWPVKISYIEANKGVYEDNERISLFGTWKHGLMTQVFVGATNVGSMTLKSEPELKTNAYYDEDVDTSIYNPEKKVNWRDFDEEIEIKKGEEVGMFKLGSTVVLVFEAPASLKWKITEGQRIKYGDTFAEI